MSPKLSYPPCKDKSRSYRSVMPSAQKLAFQSGAEVIKRPALRCILHRYDPAKT